MNVQQLPQYLNQAYEFFDSLNLSITAWVAIGLVLAVVLLLAAREAASWFFKIDDIKKDVKKMRQAIIDMEAEVHSLQSLLTQNVKLAQDAAAFEQQQPAVKPATEKPRFPVNH